MIDKKDKEYFPATIFNKYDAITSRVIKGFEIPVMSIFSDEANLDAMNNLMKDK